jgi:PAS domain S-box-containing protein
MQSDAENNEFQPGRNAVEDKDPQHKIYISATQEAAEQLKSTETAYRTIFNSVNDAIFVHDADTGLILDVNERSCELFGYQRYELIGMTHGDISSQKNGSDSAEGFRRLGLAVAGEPQQFEWEGCRKDGTTVPIEVSLRRAEINGRSRVLAVVRDISDRKHNEELLREALKRAEIATRSKSEFLANMSHEVRTPLNGIMGMAQLLKSTGMNEEQTGYLKLLDESARHLLSLISDILDISRIEAGRMKIEKTPFSLGEIVEQSLQMHRQNADNKGITLCCKFDNAPEDHLIGDPLRLKQIILNMVGNAVKFTDKGGVTVHLSQKPAPDGTVLLHLAVEDTGIGIAPEVVEKLFVPFTQGDSSTTRLYGGSGLGLAICRRLADLMGGQVWAESIQGKGSVFHLELSLVKSEIAQQ